MSSKNELNKKGGGGDTFAVKYVDSGNVLGSRRVINCACILISQIVKYTVFTENVKKKKRTRISINILYTFN